MLSLLSHVSSPVSFGPCSCYRVSGCIAYRDIVDLSMRFPVMDRHCTDVLSIDVRFLYLRL